MKKKKKGPSDTNRFRPGTTGECESQLWRFTCPPQVLADDNAPQVYRVAAESLEAALKYMRHRHHDFIIAEARDKSQDLFAEASLKNVALNVNTYLGQPLCAGLSCAARRSDRADSRAADHTRQAKVPRAPPQPANCA
jgi:hypothetical protein